MSCVLKYPQLVASLSACWRSRRRWKPTLNGWSRLWIVASSNSAAIIVADPPLRCATRSASFSLYGWLLAAVCCVSWPHRPLPDSVSCPATFDCFVLFLIFLILPSLFSPYWHWPIFIKQKRFIWCASWWMIISCTWSSCCTLTTELVSSCVTSHSTFRQNTWTLTMKVFFSDKRFFVFLLSYCNEWIQVSLPPFLPISMFHQNWLASVRIIHLPPIAIWPWVNHIMLKSWRTKRIVRTNCYFAFSWRFNVMFLFGADMETGSPSSQQQQVIVVNNTSNNDYSGLPAESASDTGAPDETFTSYDYATNVRLANGYKFTSGGGPTNTGVYTSYPATNTPPAASHQVINSYKNIFTDWKKVNVSLELLWRQLSYYPSTGFGDVSASAEQYTNGSYNAAYQQFHIRRDFSTEVIHHQVHSCSTSGGGSTGFYPPEHQQSPLVITPTTGTNYVTTAGSGDYYGTVYDVTSSASSSSSTSVYGDLNDQSHSK